MPNSIWALRRQEIAPLEPPFRPADLVLPRFRRYCVADAYLIRKPVMTTRGKLLTTGMVLAFFLLLLYNTLSAQKAECNVCVEFHNRRNCATASHSSEEEAAKSAQTTACGPLANGMNESIACGRIPPTSRVCRTR